MDLSKFWGPAIQWNYWQLPTKRLNQINSIVAIEYIWLNRKYEIEEGSLQTGNTEILASRLDQNVIPFKFLWHSFDKSRVLVYITHAAAVSEIQHLKHSAIARACTEIVIKRVICIDFKNIFKQGAIYSAASHLLQWPKTIPGGSVFRCFKVINIKALYGVI